MSELEKLKERLKSLPKDFTYDEAKSLLTKLGFIEDDKGKTSGSRKRFNRNRDKILLHKPHPRNTLDSAAVKSLLRELKKFGDIKE